MQRFLGEILIATFAHFLLVKVPLNSPEMDICFIYTHRMSLDISHGGTKEAMDTNLLEVARTVAACDHLNSIRTTILRLLFECHTRMAPYKQLPCDLFPPLLHTYICFHSLC